jgi:internalin A
MVATARHMRFLSTDRAMVAQFGDPFRPLEPDCEVIQFTEPLTPAQLRQAADLIVDRPDVQLYMYGRASTDLGFLRYFETLRRLHIAIYELDDITGFSHLDGGLEELTFSSTKRKFSLRFLETLPHLKRLFLVGHSKDLPCVRDLRELTDLGLSGVTLPDLSVLLALTGLRKLSIFLGGTKNLALLPRFPKLEDLFFMRITKLFDLGILAEIDGLKSLRLDWMRNVTSLPSFARLTQLDNVELGTMKGLTDLSSVAAAPALRRLSVTDTPQLKAESFRCFIGHPRLEELWAYTGRSTTNDAVKRMFPSIAR